MTDWDFVARTGALERRVERIGRGRTGQEQAALDATTARYDAVFSLYGERASTPRLTESVDDYRRRLLAQVAPHTEKLRTSRFDSLHAYVLEHIENEALREARDRAMDHSRQAPGTLIPVEERDRAGRLVTRFVGDIGAWMQPFTESASAGTCVVNRKP